MTTAYTSVLKLALPVTGELTGTWGDVVNNNITSMIEEAITGKASISTWTGASHTLTTADGTTSESRCAILECSGTPGGAATVICPTATKIYVIKNSVDGGFAVTLKTSGGTGISVPNGKVMWLYCDGTNVVDATNHLSSLTLASALPVTSGGTGTTTSTGSGSVVLSTSPALTTPNLGTPSAATLTNATGLPLTTGVTGTLPVANGGTGVTSSTGSGSVVLSSSPSISNPTLSSPTVSGATFNDGYTEEVYAISGTTPALSPTNGSIQTWTLTGNSTPTAGTWAAGQSMLLMVDDGTAYTVTWTSIPVTWVAGTVPVLPTSGYAVITLWKVGSTIYGSFAGSVA